MATSFNFLRDVIGAAGRGDLDAVKRWLDASPHWLNVVQSHGRTMLWEAAYRGRLEMVRFLVGRGAEIEAPGCHYTPHRIEITPYCVARWHKRHAVADYLLEAGAEASIHTAAYLDDADTVQALLDEDPERIEAGHVSTDYVRAPLHEFVRVFDRRQTPLKFALAGQGASTSVLLIERGADLRRQYAAYLDVAEDRSPALVLRLLLERGPEMPVGPIPDGDDKDALMAAYGHIQDVNEPSHGNGNLWPPLVYLCRGDRGGNPDQVRALLAKGADPEGRNHKGKSALHCAVRAGFVPATSILLAAGADPNARDNAGATPLINAVRSTIKRRTRGRECMRHLLAAGADPNAEDGTGRSAIDYATASRRPDKAEILALLSTPLRRR